MLLCAEFWCLSLKSVGFTSGIQVIYGGISWLLLKLVLALLGQVLGCPCSRRSLSKLSAQRLRGSASPPPPGWLELQHCPALHGQWWLWGHHTGSHVHSLDHRQRFRRTHWKSEVSGAPSRWSSFLYSILPSYLHPWTWPLVPQPSETTPVPWGSISYALVWKAPLGGSQGERAVSCLSKITTLWYQLFTAWNSCLPYFVQVCSFYVRRVPLILATAPWPEPKVSSRVFRNRSLRVWGKEYYICICSFVFLRWHGKDYCCSSLFLFFPLL